jgi:hypothetical protein
MSVGTGGALMTMMLWEIRVVALLAGLGAVEGGVWICRIWMDG